jgi:hypothetical protein
MESTASSRSTLKQCGICRSPIDLESSHRRWSPWPGLTIDRDLCEECGSEFEIKTRSIEDRVKAQGHSKYIEWERDTRIRKDMDRRQIKIPNA